MDIYDYIISPDVARYCRKIQKTWSPFFMAQIISRSNLSMPEKHMGLRGIIRDYPDMPTPKNMHNDSFESLHEKIKEFIETEEHFLEAFKRPQEGAIYKYKVCMYKDSVHSKSVFTSCEKALEDFYNEWKRDEISKFEMEKCYADKKERIEVMLDYDGIPYSIAVFTDENNRLPGIDYEFSHDICRFFCESFYIDIPIPFKTGDILISPASNPWDKDLIFVLDLRDEADELIQKLRAKYISGEFGDGTDMVESGHTIYGNDITSKDHVGYFDHYEYYRGKLTGKERMLHFISLYLKGEINE